VTGNSRQECRWASVLRTLPGASMPMRGFGASDCGCESHLYFFILPPSVADFWEESRNQKIERKGKHDTHMRVFQRWKHARVTPRALLTDVLN